MEGGGDRSSWLRRGRDGDRSNRLGRGRDGGVDGGGRRGSSPSTRETAAPNPNAREGDVRKETGDGTGAARQDTRWRLVGKFCSVLRAKREILRKRTAKAEKHSPPTSPASSRSIDFHARMSLSVRVALACIRYRMILGHGLVSEKNLHMLAVAIAIVCSTGDCRARRLICYSLSLLI
jgi:hypothetical protein